MTKKSDKTDQPTFEDALEGLEAVVNRLEDGSLGLDESLSEFEQGMNLLKQCHGLLQNAEQKIEILTSVSKDGTERTRPLDGQVSERPSGNDEASIGPTDLSEEAKRLF